MIGDVTFYGIAFFAIASALAVVFSKKMFHSAVFLAASFLGFGMIYFLLGANVVGAIQILIYAGSVTMLLMFVIMLTKPDSDLQKKRVGVLDRLKSVRMFTVFAAVVVLSLLAIFITQFLSAEWNVIDGAALGPLDITGIGELFLGQFVLPFELVSVVLFAALIGAVVLARTDDQDGEEA